RDFAGIKPLFYGMAETGVVFASQFDQIFRHTWIKDKLILRPEIMKEYFAFGYMQAPNTVYENIFQVNPGELIKINRGGEVEKTSIFQLNKESAEIANYDLSKIRDAIKKSVKLQLNSDRSLASF